MIFSELYSAYYNAVASIIGKLLSGETDEKELARCVSEYAFGESMLTILPSLKNEKRMAVNIELLRCDNLFRFLNVLLCCLL